MRGGDGLITKASAWKRGAFLSLSVVCALTLLFMVADCLFPLPSDKLRPLSSTVVLDKDGRLLRAFLAPDQMWRLEVAYDDVSSQLKQSVISYEDRYFRYHPGINPAAIARAALANVRAGKVVQGGSTITMQVARLIEPKERTFANKLLETFRALQLELHYSKDEILTFYFNLAPYGGNLVGVGAASRVYFNKTPDRLSLGEIALLAAIPNSPNRIRPDENPADALIARNKILRLLKDHGLVSELAYAQAISEPVPSKRFDLPFEAPHFAEYLRRLRPNQKRLHSTIDLDLQKICESMLSSHLRLLSRRGIENGAMVVIDNRSQSLRAMVGSQGFFADSGAGQVNGALAPRSPGSALKPFVYALAFDEGVVSPRNLLFDVPVDYSGYKPVNYDELYSGSVSVEDALIRSLNVPAVNLTAQLGGEKVFSLHRNGGMTTLSKPWSQYGLPLVLGGCEVTLLDLTNLYAMLANKGQYRSCRVLVEDSLVVERKLLSEPACFLVTEILAQLRRPELPAVWDASVNLPKVAWKTGTSLGKRDAWSIGYNPHYTVGVWVGNFDGKGNPAIVGAEVAAPLLFEVFNAISADEASPWFERPRQIGHRQVCLTSGMLPTDKCAVTEDEAYIEGVSPTLTCDMHELILVNRESHYRLCNHCREGHDYREQIVTRWPTEIATWMARNGHQLDVIPEHNPDCALLASGSAPIIISPADKSEFRIRDEVSLEYQKILLDASVSNESRKIFWFLNRKLIYSGDPNKKVFIEPTKGAHDLICMDDLGRSSKVSLIIR